MSHLAMSSGIRFCVSRKGGSGGGGWAHPKSADNMAVSGLGIEKPLVLAWVISLLFCTNGLRKQSSHLVRCHYSTLMHSCQLVSRNIRDSPGILCLVPCPVQKVLCPGKKSNSPVLVPRLVACSLGTEIRERPHAATLTI